MKALFVGTGSIGLRHMRNLKRIAPDTRIVAADVDDARLAAATEAGAEATVRLSGTEGDGLARALETGPDLVLVCTPPHLHLDAARAALQAGAHVFLEKPVAATLEGTEAFLADVAASDRAVIVGYNLRHERGLRRVKQLLTDGAIGRILSMRAEFGQYLPDWRPTQDYRQGYNAKAAAGGGIILDASHELDYLQWLAGEATTVYAAVGKLSDLELEVEDTALITLRLATGVLAHVHLDSVQRVYSRSCKLIGTEGTITWGFKDGVSMYRAAPRAWEIVEAPGTDPNDMYVEEMKHVRACVCGDSLPLVTAAAGVHALRVAMAAKQSAVERREIVL
jgi:predicted dehydrogenase